ncbi:MAG TPA: thioredoxin [Gemmatimonadaceae bacterium]|nr:thioredoxin [Gemmatimonadaceae bacterium]
MTESVATHTATVECAFCQTLNKVNLARIADRPKCRECKRPILLDRPVKVTDAGFERVITDATVPVLIDFYADWCGPCKIMAPVLDEIAQEQSGAVIVGKVDTDRSPVAPSKFGIRSIPTLIVFAAGKEVGREIGAVPKAKVTALLAKAGL